MNCLLHPQHITLFLVLSSCFLAGILLFSAPTISPTLLSFLKQIPDYVYSSFNTDIRTFNESSGIDFIIEVFSPLDCKLLSIGHQMYFSEPATCLEHNNAPYMLVPLNSCQIFPSMLLQLYTKGNKSSDFREWCFGLENN